MRRQVLELEVPQFKELVNEIYNKAAYKPKITVIIVNKRISQRFFVQDANGNLVNPPSGCIIDKNLVENQGKDEYDFFMSPASATQGCVLPTHFYVPYNDSELTKKEVEELTFALCFYYFNWAGAIKVPAPCQYAHKIAEYYTHLGVNNSQKK